MSAPTSPTVVVTTPEQLAELVRGAVASALAEQSQDAGPALLDRNGIARALGIGTSSLDRLRRDGLPFLLVGDAPRFIVADCVKWLTEHCGRRVP